MDEEQSLEQLSQILNSISEQPLDVSLHAQHILLSQQLQDNAQLAQAAEMMTTFLAAGDEAWVPRVEYALASSKLETEGDVESLLELFNLAEGDYLSIPIMERHVQFLLDKHELYHGDDAQPKPSELGDAFSTEWTRSRVADVADKAKGHVTQSYRVWDKQRDWLLACLDAAEGPNKSAWIEYIDSAFASRINQPHSNSDETFQFYSSFISNNKPAVQYEEILVKASKTRGRAVKSYDRWERIERQLRESGYSLEVYAEYVSTDRRTNPELYVSAGIHERAIAEAAKRRFKGQDGAELALRTFWVSYLDRMRIRIDGSQLDFSALGPLSTRASRSVPASGEVWTRYLRYMERATTDSNLIEGVYDSAMSSGLLQKDAQELIPVVMARATFLKRDLEADSDSPPDAFQKIIETLSGGIEFVRQATSSGDPQLQLEKFLTKLYNLAGLHSNAAELWQSATQFYKTSYLAWVSYTDALIQAEEFEKAREVFQSPQIKSTDWPEAIWSAWMLFENLHGTVQEVEAAFDKIEKAKVSVNARRAKEAYDAMKLAAEQQASVPVQEARAQSHFHQQSSAAGDTAMQVDQLLGEVATGSKRKVEEDQPTSSKKARTENPVTLKRDRENSTVFVGNLPAGVNKEQLTALFQDCGDIREIHITVVQGLHVATVEFNERESVPAALTKDKKRIEDQEIEVHLAWRSTLYVTNFPEKTDDAEVRSMFGQYGTIFSVRWPSKKFKSTRRFCYVQFTSPDAAQSSLQLHGRELEPGKTLNVYISDPGRKKERTDADANDRELYVAGLSKYTTKEDLEKIFRTYGEVKEVRMTVDSDGKCKGFAFVEFVDEASARAGLAANNHELHKRRIAVTVSDPRVRAKNRQFQSDTGLGKNAERSSRTLWVMKLPADTQEGLLQQELEKLARVSRVEVFQDKREALVELESAADAGKLLLRKDPLVFMGQQLAITQDQTGGGTIKGSEPTPAANSKMFVPRATGHARLGTRRTQASRAGGQQAKSSATTQDDFRKMLG